MPKVSVIIPVYNSEKTLVRCLESVVNQTLSDIEIVVIDDGSNDKSCCIIDLYVRKYSNIITRRIKNSGQGVARNIGIDMSHGDYIAFLDSDDYSDVTRLEMLYNLAVDNDADYVGCGYAEVIESEDKSFVSNVCIVNKSCKNNYEMLLNRALVNPLLSFYKREVLTANNITFTEGFIYEDTAFWAKSIPYIKKMCYIEQSLSFHTIHDNSTMTSISYERVRCIFPVVSDILNFYDSNGLLNEYKDEIEYFCARILLCSSIERISKVDENEKRRQLLIETYEYIKAKIPNYKSNKYLNKSLICQYMKHSNYLISYLVIRLLRIKRALLK